MAETDITFNHSTPALYDRYMGPLLFAPYAKLVAERSALLRPTRILETAAGTGIVTRAVNQAVPQAQIVATDLNPEVLEFAARRVGSERVAFQRADAQDLPFAEGSFDLVLCQFGMMFFPDKVRATEKRGACFVPAVITCSSPSTASSLTRCRKRRRTQSPRCFPAIHLCTWSAARSAMPIQRSSSMIRSRPASRASSLRRSHYPAT